MSYKKEVSSTYVA